MTLTAGDEVTFEGENGHRWTGTVPDAGPRRDVLESLIAIGVVTVISDAAPSAPAADDAADDEVPTGRIDQIVAWVRQAPDGEYAADGWPERAQAALDAEMAKGERARSTLIDTLTEALAG